MGTSCVPRDRIPVPGRADCPQAHRNVPDGAECPHPARSPHKQDEPGARTLDSLAHPTSSERSANPGPPRCHVSRKVTHGALRPTTGIKALGCLCALAAVGLSALYPLVLFGASWTLGKVDEAMMADPGEPSRAVTPASYLIAWTTIYSFILTTLCFGAVFCFVGVSWASTGG